MSRIHDALKKAEAERTKQSLSSLDPMAPEPEIVPAVRNGGFSSVGDELDVSPRGGVEDRLEPLTVASLNSDTHKYSWKPSA